MTAGCRNGYGVDPPGQANMAICSGAVGQRYNALAFTLEMPFKDTNYSREPVRSCLCWPHAEGLGLQGLASWVNGVSRCVACHAFPSVRWSTIGI